MAQTPTNELDLLLQATSTRVLGVPTGTFTLGSPAITVVYNANATMDVSIAFTYEQGDVKADELAVLVNASLVAIPSAPTMASHLNKWTAQTDATNYIWQGVNPEFFNRASIVARQLINGVWYNTAEFSPSEWVVEGTAPVFGGTVTETGKPWPISASWETPTASGYFIDFVPGVACKLVAGLSGAKGQSETVTGSNTWTIQKLSSSNTVVQSGSFSFGAGTISAATFTLSTNILFNGVDERLRVLAPATLDATQKNISITLPAVKQ